MSDAGGGAINKRGRDRLVFSVARQDTDRIRGASVSHVILDDCQDMLPEDEVSVIETDRTGGKYIKP